MVALRAADKAAIAAVMRSEYATTEEATKALFDAVIARLSERETTIVHLKAGGQHVYVGPFFDKNQLKAYLKTLATPVSLISLYPAGVHLQKISEQFLAMDPDHTCHVCDHPDVCHWDGTCKAVTPDGCCQCSV